MAVYFLRHGESEANVNGVFDGQGLNAKLTPLGEQQAARAAEDMKGLDIKQIYASPLNRTKRTAEIVAEVIGYPLGEIQYDARIMEHDWGSLSGASWDIDEGKKAELLADAEPNAEFQKRILSFFKELKPAGQNILIVSHGGVGSMLEASRTGADVSRHYEVISYPNAHVVALDLSWLH